MRAMGIDPGTAICGFGVIDADGSRLKPVTYGTIQTTPDHTDAERLGRLFDGLNQLYKKYKPDVIGVEQLFFNRNVTTASTVGQALGIILLTAQQAGIPILEFSPLQVKQGVTGYGRATKDQVIDMTMRLLGIRQKIKPDDAADALAIAICHALRPAGALQGGEREQHLTAAQRQWAQASQKAARRQGVRRGM